MKVLKFGGTSVGKGLELVADIVAESASSDDVVIVASALSGVTDSLIKMANLAKLQKDAEAQAEYHSLVTRHIKVCKDIGSQTVEAEVTCLLDEIKVITEGIKILKELSGRTLDLVMSFGERLSCTLLAGLLTEKKQVKSEMCDARKLFVTDSNFTNAKLNRKDTEEKVLEFFKQPTDTIKIVTGFIATSKECNETTTLGRGGGDLSASVLGSILKVSEIQVWTDVDGVLTANPNLVPTAAVIPTLSYEEAMELSYFGAKVIYAPTMAPAMRSQVPIRIKNTFNPEAPGTLIRQYPDKPSFKIRAITSIPEIVLVVLAGSDMVGVAGVASRLFSVLARELINVILISQASSEHSICIAIDPKSGKRAKQLIDEEFEREIDKGYVDEVQLLTNLSVIAVIGAQMKTVPGIAGLITTVMGEQGINIVALAQGSSELNMSIVVDKFNEPAALQCVHETFFNNGSVHNEPRHLLRGKNSLHCFLVLGDYIDPEAWIQSLSSRLTVKIAGIFHKNKVIYSIPSSESDGKSPTKIVRSASTPSITMDSWNELDKAESTISEFYQQLMCHKATVGGLIDCVLIDQSNQSSSPNHYNEFLAVGGVVVTANESLWKQANSFNFEDNSFIWSTSIPWVANTVLAALLSQRGAIKRVVLTEISPDTELYNGAYETQLQALSSPCDNVVVCYGTSPAENEYSIIVETDDEMTSMQSTVGVVPRGPAYILRKMSSYLKHPLN